MEAVLEQKQVWEQEKTTEKIAGFEKKEQKVGFFAGIFGCWHKELSRPFTTRRESYRACLNCGARKHFDPETLQSYGAFYFAPETNIVKTEKVF